MKSPLQLKMYSRSKRIVDLVINSENEQQQDIDRESVILNAESPLPTNCAFNESDWNNLKELVDDELSSDRNLAQEELHSFRIPSVRPCTSVIIEDSDESSSIVMDSRETTPVPFPNSDFGSPVQEPSKQLGEYHTEPIASLPSINSYITVSECDSPCSTVVNKRKRTFKCNVGKKRLKCPEKWIDNKRKYLLNSGQQYLSRNGKVKKKKELRPICLTSCKMKCSEKFDSDTRQNIFKNFWELADHTRQWEFINKFTEKINKKRVTTEGPSRRQFTTKYFLPIPTDNTFTPEQVCLKTFLNTLCITDQFVRTAHNKINQEGITLCDNRGKHSNHPNIVDSVMVKSVCDHVASFQPVHSHYTRKDSSKLYLDNNLNMHKMFSLYKEWHQLSNYENQAHTLRQYRDIINANMNVGFFIPKKDICDKCHSFSNNSSPTEEQVQTHNKHLQNKTIARDIKNNDKQQSRESPDTVCCATFDFQKILNCPHGDVGLFYYKRKLSVFNFTVFDLALKEGTCYMWTECTGKRGANEVSSCLMHFINAKIDQGVKKFLFWSDNCAGQNRNRVVYSLYMHILSKRFDVDITHRFLEQGHTQNEGDSVHALIERESKRKLIYTPDQWYALVRWAKSEGRPYKVVEVTSSDLYDFKFLLEDKNWKKDNRNENVKWNSIKEVSVRKEEPDRLYFKYDLKGDYFCINTTVETRSRKRRKCQPTELKNLYMDSLALPVAKYKDLISLCRSGAIPKEYHRFYENLKYSAVAEISDNCDESDD